MATSFATLAAEDKAVFEERRAFDFYPTERWAVRAAVRRILHLLDPDYTIRALDPGAGTGVWGEELEDVAYSCGDEVWVEGVEVRQAPYNPYFDSWQTAAFVKPATKPVPPKLPKSPTQKQLQNYERSMQRYRDRLFIYESKLFRPDPRGYNLILGNPPYDQAEAFVHRSMEIVEDGGVVAFLLRLAFLEGQARYKTLYSRYMPIYVDTYTSRPSFMPEDHPKAGKTDATAYALFVWHKGENPKRYSGGFLNEEDGA